MLSAPHLNSIMRVCVRRMAQKSCTPQHAWVEVTVHNQPQWILWPSYLSHRRQTFVHVQQFQQFVVQLFRDTIGAVGGTDWKLLAPRDLRL